MVTHNNNQPATNSNNQQHPTMDPNYHYLVCAGDSIIVRKNAPFAEMGLNTDRITPRFRSSYSLANLLYDWEKSSDENKQILVNYILNLDTAMKKHIFIQKPHEFRIVRIPKELAKYTSIRQKKVYYKGGYGYIIEESVKVDRNKAIADFTKETLEDPTPEKIAHLKEKITFFENVALMKIKTNIKSEEYDDGQDHYHSSDYDCDNSDSDCDSDCDYDCDSDCD